MEVDLNPPEAADRRVYLRLPPDLHRMAAAQAEYEGVPLNWWIIKTLDELFGTGRKPRPRQLG